MANQIEDVIFIGVKGTILALKRSTGVELWRITLKGTDFVNLILDRENLYATTRGEIYCFDPATGICRWHNRLSGLGYGIVCIATASGSQILSAEKTRRDQASRAAAAAAAS